MLPFLPNRKQTEASVSKVVQSESSDGLKECARELLSALKSENEDKIAKALRNCYHMCVMELHEDKD